MPRVTENIVLAIDQGTHASRAILWGPRGEVRFTAAREVELQRLAGGRVEQDAGGILSATRAVIDEACARATEAGWAIDAAGLAVQRSTVVAWDRETGEALAPAPSWQDTRAADRLVPLEGRAREIADRTGLRLSPHYGASKMAWLLEECAAVDDAFRRGALVMGPLATWLLNGLRSVGSEAGRPEVDHANASRTLLWNLDRRDWDPELISAFGLPVEVLPASRPILTDWGQLSAGDIPLRVVTGDQNAAIFADGPLVPGVARVNLGTGAFVLAPTGRRIAPISRLLRGVAASDADGAEYLVEGTVNGAGAAFSWAAREWGLENPVARLEESFSVRSEPPVFLNGVGGVGSPWWKPDLRSEWLGDPAAGPLERIRAIGESVLFLLRANLDAMREAGEDLHEIRISGGLSRSAAMCRGLAALSGLRVRRGEHAEATARGVAWLAAGRPDDWDPGDGGEVFEPVSDPAAESRYLRFHAAMEERSERLPPR